MKKGLILVSLLLLGCQGPKGDPGHDGTNGANGSSGPSGPMGFTGLQGPAGINMTIPFNYDGTMIFPVTQVMQRVPGLSLDRGDLINVYLSWQNQPWTQIGSTWVGGMAGSYAVVGETVTITVVVGPQAPRVDWAINGVKHQ